MQPDSSQGGAGPSRVDPPLVRWGLTLAALAVLTVLIIIPVVHVFYEALSPGLSAYLAALQEKNTVKAIKLTLTVVPIAVALNVVFGVTAAWAISRFRFPGRSILLTLIDLPFAVSPIVVGLALVLVFGQIGFFGELLQSHGIKVLYATPALVLATSFVTFPFVARELIPTMEAEGPEEELAALTLGASGWQMFWRVTIPNIKWSLLYGVILCTARAAGEFGAVYVVSSRVPGNVTVPLWVHRLFEDSRGHASFAVASVLTSLALVTLVLKTWLDRGERRRVKMLRKDT